MSANKEILDILKQKQYIAIVNSEEYRVIFSKIVYGLY